VAVVVPIVSEWNPKGVQRSLADIKKAEGGWGKTGAAFKSALVPATAALGAVGFAAFGAAKEAEEARKANARLGQVFKSIGYPDLADDAAAFADALALQIGVDDEIIKAGQAKLATFSEVAKSSDTMAKATSLAADLAATGFGDISSASTMIGKALQDPVKGMTALGKAGVTFTQAQKDQIKAMVKANDVAGAQAIILGEVEKQVGGVAKASASTSDKIAVQFGEVKESFGEAALPLLDALLPALETVAKWITDNKQLFITLAVAIAGVSAAVIAVNAAMTAFTAIKTVITAVTAVIKIVKAWTVVQWLLNASLLANPIGLVIIAVAALVAIIVVAWKKSETFRKIVTGAFDAVKRAAQSVWDWIKRNWPLLLAILTGPVGLAVLFIVKNWDKVKSALSSFIDWVKRVWRTALDPIKNAFQSLVDFVSRIIDRIKGMWDGVKNIVSNLNPFNRSGPINVRSASSRAAGSAAGGINITVNGALDSERVGRQIQRILEDHAGRQGRVTATRAVAW
jgi:hypothetical protein